MLVHCGYKASRPQTLSQPITWWNVCRKLFMEFCCSYRTTPPSTLFHTWVNVGIELHTLKLSKTSKTGQPLHESWTLCVTTLFVGFDRCFLQNSIYMLKFSNFCDFAKQTHIIFIFDWLSFVRVNQAERCPEQHGEKLHIVYESQ